MRFAPDFMIMQRRKEEENRGIYDEKTKMNSAYERVAVWEHKTGKAIERGVVTRKVETMKQDLERDLEGRRARLAALLAEEDARYTAELEQLEETPDSRRDRLKSRARELVRRREQEKREFAKEMRERQFRETCDQFREYDGVHLLRECVAARDKAMIERGEEKKRQKEEVAMWHSNLLEEVGRQEKREAADAGRGGELQAEMLRTLQEQVAELNARRAEDERLKNEEARLMKERFELDVAEARAKEEARAKMFAEKKVAIARHNAILRAEKEAEIRRQQEEDLALLNAMLEKERKAEAAEMAYKASLKAQAREYQAQLIELMKKEAVDEAASEAIRQAEQDKAWRKREEVWEQERAAREKLMKEVIEVRRQQLQQRLEQNRIDREAALVEREAMLAEVEEQEAGRILEAKIRKNIMKEHQHDILAQVDEARARMRRDMEIAALELEASRREEEAYQAKLQKEMLLAAQGRHKNHGLKSTGLF